MRPSSLRDRIKDAYAPESLSPELLTRLSRLALMQQSGPEGAAMRRLRRWRAASIVLGAAAAVLLLTTVYLSNSRLAAPSERDAPRSPQLVVVRVHADWCGVSLALEPFYSELGEKYRNQAVLFVSLDVTDEKQRREAIELASELGIELVTEKPFVPGVIKLVNRERNEILAVVSDGDEVDLVERVLVKALPRGP